MRLWKAQCLRAMKHKAHIHVDKSAFVIGCVDESGTLRGHRAATEGRDSKNVDDLPQIFLQYSDPKTSSTVVLKGICIVGRNPSLHPGDIRVVQAVDNPSLRHLKNVVVFPSTGDNPVPSMLSGGDLDGDDFFVIWEPTLLPKKWNTAPMDFTAAKPKELDRDVNVNDYKQFFVQYIQNDALGPIAHSHLAFADMHGPDTQLCKYRGP